ncbi:MAG: hypothetical protein JNJ65_18350 [Cyclobacteriaceae bacterium]|nr:hypothetical protein [Cyclobacteriaceae bacterium]
MLFIRILVVLVLTSSLCVGQELDTTNTRVLIDTVGQGKRVENIESYAKRYDPRKAMLYSAVLPGMGQTYNKKYWKLPIVYGGFAVLIYVVDAYQDQYLTYRQDLFYVVNEEPPNGLGTTGYTEDQLRTLVDRSRRERDYFLILSGMWYILQLVDAHVDAHLKEFEVNPRMQVRLEPMMENTMLTGRSTGIRLSLRF